MTHSPVGWPDRCDVAIVGAGAAGCATAIELRRLGVPSVVIFDGGHRAHPVGESLPPDARVPLGRLGVLDRFERDRHEPSRGSCSAWGSAMVGYNDYVFNPHGDGWHLDRSRFDECLATRSREAGAVSVPARATTDGRDSSGRHVVRCGTRRLAADFIVDATGTAARIGRRLGAHRAVDDRLFCVIGFFDLPDRSTLGQLTLLEATPYGWWYAARLPGDRAVAICATQKPRRTLSYAELETRWTSLVTETELVGPALREARLVPGSLGARTATSGLTKPSAGDRWISVGDAAAAHDPLCAQGLFQALDGGISSAVAIAAWLGGDRTAVDRYDRDVQLMFDQYRTNRRYLYGLEQRWSTEPFWRARHAQRTGGSTIVNR